MSIKNSKKFITLFLSGIILFSVSSVNAENAKSDCNLKHPTGHKVLGESHKGTYISLNKQLFLTEKQIKQVGEIKIKFKNNVMPVLSDLQKETEKLSCLVNDNASQEEIKKQEKIIAPVKSKLHLSSSIIEEEFIKILNKKQVEKYNNLKVLQSEKNSYIYNSHYVVRTTLLFMQNQDLNTGHHHNFKSPYKNVISQFSIDKNQKIVVDKLNNELNETISPKLNELSNAIHKLSQMINKKASSDAIKKQQHLICSLKSSLNSLYSDLEEELILSLSKEQYSKYIKLKNLFSAEISLSQNQSSDLTVFLIH